MNLRLSPQRNAAMTLFEVGVVVAILMVLAVIFFQYLLPPRHLVRRSSRIGCINNLMQIGLAYRVWEGDNGDIYPMGISVTNGGSKETVATGNVVQTFLLMSNELSTPRILVCPADSSRTAALSFTGLANSNVSYFIGVDVTNEANPKMILSGDGNLQVGGIPVKPGLQAFGARDPVAWTATRHINAGNIGLVDGSAQQVDDSGLTNLLGLTGIATNRFAIP